MICKGKKRPEPEGSWPLKKSRNIKGKIIKKVNMILQYFLSYIRTNSVLIE